MKLESKFLTVAVIAVIAAVPISLNMQKRSKALDSERVENHGLHLKIDSLQKQLEIQHAHDEQIRKENLKLQKELEAKIAREEWLASLTFPVGAAPSWKVRDALAYYMDAGLSKTAAAYLVGDLVAESSLNQDDVGDGGLALGIAQWHPNRREDMPADFHGQLSFVLTEMRRETPDAYQLMMDDPTPDEATLAMKAWEAYGIEAGRGAYAQYILEKI